MPRIAPIRDLIFAYIQAHPRVTSRDIANGLNMDENCVAGTLNHLFTKGLVTRTRPSRHFEYTANVVRKTEASVSELDLLKAELEAAQAWRAEAEAKHPDLVKRFDYEAYRPAITYLAYSVSWPDLSDITEGRPFTSTEEAFIHDLIFVASLMPQGDVA